MKTAYPHWFLLLCAVGTIACAQGYVIVTPGRLPETVTTTPGGGFMATTPGELPSYGTPNPGGGYTVTTPGQLPTYINLQ